MRTSTPDRHRTRKSFGTHTQAVGGGGGGGAQAAVLVALVEKAVEEAEETWESPGSAACPTKPRHNTIPTSVPPAEGLSLLIE
eukprot:3885728-Prymnesium_polylepis.1